MSAGSFTKMAPFEREVAARIRSGGDYWFGNRGRVGSRGPSQALSRLKKKGFINWPAPAPGEPQLTPAGIAELDRLGAPTG